mgnify:CR=1 FL=1
MDFWGFIRRRKTFFILFAAIGAGVGYFNFTRQEDRFSSSALIQIVHHRGDAHLQAIQASQSIQDAPHLVKSASLLEECTPVFRELVTFKDLFSRGQDGEVTFDEKAAVRRAAGTISVKSNTNSVLTISVEGAIREDTEKIANVVADVYTDYHKDTFQSALKKFSGLLDQASETLDIKLATAVKEFHEWEKNESSLTVEGVNPHAADHAALLSKISGIALQETEISAKLKSLTDKAQDEDGRQALLFLVGRYSNQNAHEINRTVDESVLNTRTMFGQLFPLLMQEAELANKVGPGHPELLKIRQQIQLTRRHFEVLAGLQPEENAADEETDPAADIVNIYVSSLEHELAVLQRTRSELEKQAKTKESLARALKTDMVTREQYERKIANLEMIFADVSGQIEATQLPTNQPAEPTADVLNRAALGEKVYPKLSQFLTYGALLGALIGAAIGYVVESADRSFRRPEEIVKEFGLPILAHVPFMQEQKLRKVSKDRAMDRTVITMHLPRSRPSEAYRTARTAICFNAHGNEHRVIQVTSPAAGDGKSTLAINLAVTLAQSGKNTVIIESDFRRPKVHKLTGVSNDVGVVDVLRGRAELADTIQDTEVPGLSVIPCGKRPRDPSELLTRPEYEQLLEVLREKFEYVIIDTPPVLVVNDPCSVAPRADGVLLCVRLSRHSRDFGGRAIEQLGDVGANIAGLVVNGVEEADAYGYGNYRYSDYRYRYRGYGYGYGYGGAKSEAYFEDSEESGDLSQSGTLLISDESEK